MARFFFLFKSYRIFFAVADGDTRARYRYVTDHAAIKVTLWFDRFFQCELSTFSAVKKSCVCVCEKGRCMILFPS